MYVYYIVSLVYKTMHIYTLLAVYIITKYTTMYHNMYVSACGLLCICIWAAGVQTR